MKFYGDYKSFPSYLDLYDALIHNNVSLSAIEKFNYLISSLHGPPLSLVRTLSLTTDNYTIAYDALVKRYSNSRLRAQALWPELDNAPKVNSDNVSNLRKLLDNYSENLAALKQMKFPADSWDFLLLMMLLKRLDHGIVTRFELEHGSSSIPKYIDLADFLEKHCLALDTFVLPSFGQVERNNYNINSADDFVGGASTFEEARVLITELIALMKLGGFELRKWSSNEPSLLSDLPESHLSTNSLSFDNDHENTTLKVLGLHWNPSFDCFHFSFNPSAD
ncbi:hypothetical protein JTB14_002589 [Gonioctena quinquepunctata]|nr:hypothetical protein JTB14_002589 [Gonioctena quinquepunctata]